MKKYAIGSLTLSFATFAFAGPGRQDTTARLQAAGTVLNEIMAAPDKGIPEEVLNGAKCIAVVPSMAKGGFIVGGEHGRGVVTCRTGHGWSAPAFISIGGGNFGFQAGAQSVDLVMLFMNDKGVQGLLSSKFELSGEASAAAGPVGRHASAGTDWKMNTEALSYSRTKGLFAGVAVDGAKIQQDNDSTVAIYGKDVSFRKTLSGDVHAPSERRVVSRGGQRCRERRRAEHETAESQVIETCRCASPNAAHRLSEAAASHWQKGFRENVADQPPRTPPARPTVQPDRGPMSLPKTLPFRRPLSNRGATVAVLRSSRRTGSMRP